MDKDETTGAQSCEDCGNTVVIWYSVNSEGIYCQSCTQKRLDILSENNTEVER